MLLKIFILYNTNKINVHGRSGILLQQHSNIRFRCGGGGGPAFPSKSVKGEGRTGRLSQKRPRGVGAGGGGGPPSPSRLVNEERATEHFSQNVRLAAGRGGEHFYC